MYRIYSNRGVFALAVGAMIALSAAPAAAQVGATQGASAGAYDAERIITKVQQQDLAAVVRQRGDTVVSEREQGNYSVLGQTPDGLYYILIGTACDLPDYGEGCLGIDFQVRYTADYRATFERINQANISFSAAKVSRGNDENGTDTVFVTHYTMLDGGQKMGNLDIIVLNLLDIAPQVADIVFP